MFSYTWDFKGIYIRFSKRDLLLISYKHYILIKRYFQRFWNHAFHLLAYSVRSDSPQLFFSGSRELEVISPTLRRTLSSPAILCRLIWYCIFYRHRSSGIICTSMFYYALCIWKNLWYGLYLCMIWVWLGIYEKCEIMNVMCI